MTLRHDNDVLVRHTANLRGGALARQDTLTELHREADVKLAELEIRRNPLIEAIKAQQNNLALEAAKNRERQATQDYTNKKTTSAAGIVTSSMWSGSCLPPPPNCLFQSASTSAAASGPW